MHGKVPGFDVPKPLGPCPSCDSPRVAWILYGYPAPHVFEAMTEEFPRRGEVNGRLFVLGGCCVFDDQPAWKCLDCGTGIDEKGNTIAAAVDGD